VLGRAPAMHGRGSRRKRGGTKKVSRCPYTTLSVQNRQTKHCLPRGSLIGNLKIDHGPRARKTRDRPRQKQNSLIPGAGGDGIAWLESRSGLHLKGKELVEREESFIGK